MEAEIKLHHRKLNNDLQSIKVMLASKRHLLQPEEWHHLIEITKHAILSNPYQYFDSELPGHETLKAVVDSIFQKFVEDQNIR